MLTEQDHRFAREIVVESKLFFPTALQFNDPFEASPAIIVDMNPPVLRRHLRDLIGRNMPQASRNRRREVLTDLLRQPPSALQRFAENASRETLSDIGLCSMASQNDNVLMWSHYAASHTGICLGFQTQPFDFRSAICRAYPVRYETDRPRQDPLSGMAPEPLFDLLLTKAEFWQYEEEFRLVREEPAGGAGHEYFSPERLASITFGLRTPPEIIEMVQQWVQERGRDVQLKIATADKLVFGLKISDWPVGAVD
jgi:hypothetical protein